MVLTEHFFSIFEDIDLCLRHRKRGGRCGVSRNLKVMHTRGVASRRIANLQNLTIGKAKKSFGNVTVIGGLDGG